MRRAPRRPAVWGQVDSLVSGEVSGVASSAALARLVDALPVDALPVDALPVDVLAADALVVDRLVVRDVALADLAAAALDVDFARAVLALRRAGALPLADEEPGP